MKRTLILLYGVGGYLFFFITFCYAIGFVGNLVVPKTIDSGETAPLLETLLVNLGLLSLFAIQHTIMARPWFKRWVTRYIDPSIERSTFVWVATAILAALMWQWRPLPEVVWDVANPVLAGVLWALFALGWAMVLYSSFLINHFELFGLKQVYAAWRGTEQTRPRFVMPWLYRLVRHPLMVGFLIAFWATPHMSVGHLLFAAVTTGYILFGTFIEERDLIREHGDSYREYRRQVRGLIPIPRRRNDVEVSTSSA